MVQGLVLVLGMVRGLVQGLKQVLYFFGVSMLHNNGRGGSYTTNLPQTGKDTYRGDLLRVCGSQALI